MAYIYEYPVKQHKSGKEILFYTFDFRVKDELLPDPFTSSEYGIKVTVDQYNDKVKLKEIIVEHLAELELGLDKEMSKTIEVDIPQGDIGVTVSPQDVEDKKNG